MKTALYAFIVSALLGLGLVVAGVFVLCGLGTALIAGGVSMIVVAAFIRAGLRAGASGG